jgi:hypothetical protein
MPTGDRNLVNARGRKEFEILRPLHRKRADIEQCVIASDRTSSEFAVGETIALSWMVEMGIETFQARA